MRPEDIKNRTFANQLRGYDKTEVRSFLFRVAESSRELHEQLTATEASLASAEAVEARPPMPDVPAAFESSADADALRPPSFAGASFERPLPEGASFDIGSFDASETDSVDTAIAAPVADQSTPSPEAFVEAPTESLAAAEQSIADRYGAIGDRIADLLRNADESAADILARAKNDSEATRLAADEEAAQVRLDAETHASELLAEAQTIRAEADAYRDEVMSELATARLEQEAAVQEARTSAEAEVETYRVDSIAEITSLRTDAFVEIDELRSGATSEVAELRSVAQTESETLRESVLAEASASIADDEADAALLRNEAEADRAAARAELDDVRSEVNTLLEQARTQSEFIKQEADEIIRTKVRANFEQAQTRIDVLRNTEVASRERIVLAQTELASALTRLDSEPVPVLDPTDSRPVIQEAVARHDEIAAPAETFEVDAGEHAADTDVADTYAADADAHVIDADVIDTDSVDVDVADVEGFETDESETDDIETYVDNDTAIDPQNDEEASLSNYFGPGADEEQPETTGDILAGAFARRADPELADQELVEDELDDTFVAEMPEVDATRADVIDSGWPTTEYSEVESVEYDSVSAPTPVADDAEFDVAEAFEAPQELPTIAGDFDVTEHVVVESAEYGDLSAGETTSGLPVRGQDQPQAYTAPATYGAASLSDALPVDDAPELGGAAQEDALARLVREAMQEAVDSARKND